MESLTAMEKRTLESLKRKLAENEFLEYVRQAWHVIEPDVRFVEGWHIEAICQHLQAVTEGHITQLLVNVPPGTSKSSLVCVFWPTWVWTRRPGTRWLFASYSDHLTTRDSIKCRNLICSDWYQKRWGKKFQLTADQNAKTKFDTTAGGWRLATSIGGVSTGEHPGYVVFDDPHKIKGVESDTERQTVIDWWDGAMASRGLIRGVKRVGIMQRLHQRDLSGHLLNKGGWQHICLPMEFEKDRMKPTKLGWTDPRKEEGELLWPQVYSRERLDQIKLDLGLYHSAGQLQQRPSPRGGGMFKRGWFSIVPEVPPDLERHVRYWDKAGTKDGEGARTASVLMARTRDKRYFILDVIKGRWSAGERELIIKQTAETDRHRWGWLETWVEQEPGSGGKESAENTIANLEGFTCYAEKVTGDKTTRAEPLQSYASIGRVLLLVGHWNAEFIEEAELFPMGRLKDQVDAASGAFNKLAASKLTNITDGAAIERKVLSSDETSFSERLTALDY